MRGTVRRFITIISRDSTFLFVAERNRYSWIGKDTAKIGDDEKGQPKVEDKDNKVPKKGSRGLATDFLGTKKYRCCN
jgi:hypothetical protein